MKIVLLEIFTHKYSQAGSYFNTAFKTRQILNKYIAFEDVKCEYWHSYHRLCAGFESF